jgi:hypothetical protein
MLPIEGCHAVLKAYFQVSTSDLKSVFDCLLPYWPIQHLAIQYIRAIEQNKVIHQLNKQYFDLVIYLVYNKALLLIIQQYAKLHQKEEEASLDWLCQYSLQASIRLPCYHILFERFCSNSQVLPEDIYSFW